MYNAGLVLLNEFNGQNVLTLLEEHHLMYVIVPTSWTYRLHPFDINVASCLML